MLTLKQPIKINVQFITWKFLDIKMTFLTPKYQINCQITNIFSVKTQHTKNSSSEHFLFLTIRYLYHMLDYIINPPFFVLTYFIIIFILEKYLTLNFSFSKPWTTRMKDRRKVIFVHDSGKMALGFSHYYVIQGLANTFFWII